MDHLDDRLQLAADVINLRRREAGHGPLSPAEMAVLRDPLGWRPYVSAASLLIWPNGMHGTEVPENEDPPVLGACRSECRALARHGVSDAGRSALLMARADRSLGRAHEELRPRDTLDLVPLEEESTSGVVLGWHGNIDNFRVSRVAEYPTRPRPLVKPSWLSRIGPLHLILLLLLGIAFECWRVLS